MIQEIINQFVKFMMPPTVNDQFAQVGRAKLEAKIRDFVARNAPLEFYMLGFPFKSTNQRDKVLSDMPDMAEYETLANFSRFNKVLSSIYPHGIRINMVTDGYIFNDLLGVSDKVVERYKSISQEMSQDVHAPLSFYDVRDFYTSDIAKSRELVTKDFGISPEKLEQDILFNPDVNYLYRGMMLFMQEELAHKTFPSVHQMKKAAKALARQVMFRSEAYSNLAKHEFGGYIRLSMHPSINVDKYSFQLIEGSRYSAWHSCLVVCGDVKRTIHRNEAKENYKLIYKGDQPYYYETA